MLGVLLDSRLYDEEWGEENPSPAFWQLLVARKFSPSGWEI